MSKGAVACIPSRRPQRDVARDQLSLTEAVRPSPRELAVARRHIHLKAVVIAVLALGSYWSLVMAQSSVVEKLLSTVVLVVALTAAATCVFHDANHSSFSTSRIVNRLAGPQCRRCRRGHRPGSIRPFGT
jgi:fatty acid desaturase